MDILSNLDKTILKMAPNADKALVKSLVPSLKKYMKLAEINTVLRVSHFLANTAVESASFTTLEENLNYSENALLRVFRKYFTPTEAKNAARRPEHIANIVYANRMGNGNYASGDGWTNRGMGIMQITGADNRASFLARHPELDPKGDPDWWMKPEIAAQTAVDFWVRRKLNKFADRNDVVRVRRRINGGTHGLHDVKLFIGRAVKALGASEKPKTKTPVLRIGYNGEAVTKLQKLVIVAGYPKHLVLDEIFGPATHNAVEWFQMKLGLVVDGIVGRMTWAKLSE